jgi:methionine--tRNA ligase beta chain
MTEEAKPIVGYADFVKLDLRVAKVLAVSDHPNAEKLIVLDIDMGGQQRRIVAGLKPYLTDPQSLVGKSLVIVANLEPRKMRGIESNGMLLAASYGQGDEMKVVVLTTDEPVPAGASVS